jgi:hypothetical protein
MRHQARRPAGGQPGHGSSFVGDQPIVQDCPEGETCVAYSSGGSFDGIAEDA